ncbi:MAG TPA: hypothetical protein ENJ00_06530 [Phycisphaerales bacterium]|nr:hypothetical protein [Phycisphaerales bacterium]
MPKSVMDGIEFAEKRRPVDADWTKRKRIVVGSAIALLACAAVGYGGFIAWQNRPVHLPTSAEQAIATINSGRVDRLGEDRKRQYFAEAARLMREVPEDKRRDLFTQENRDAMRQVMMEQMDTSIREIARGNMTIEQFRQQMMERFRNRRPEGDRPERGERDRNGPSERPSAGDRRERFVGRMSNMFQNGDGQRMGLMMGFRAQMPRRAAGESRSGPPGGG